MRYLVAFWNLENLFAPEGFTPREPWIAQEVASDLRGWTQALFDTKIGQLASIISQMKGGAGPDLLGVCEVENRYCLEQLAARLNAIRPARRYELVHADAVRDRRGIDTAFLYDANVLSTNPAELFSHWVMRRTGTRDITQATFITQAGRELVALANHWPSRSGSSGPERSSGFRATAGETLAYWHGRIREVKGASTAILVMGDLNDDPFDASVMVHALGLRERGDVERAQSPKLYNLAWRYLTQAATDHNGNPRTLDGTLYFSDDGNVFDQILVSTALLKGPNPLKADVATARIEAFQEMVDHRVGVGPIRFGLPKGNAIANVNTSGFSDHFPVSVEIVEAP